MTCRSAAIKHIFSIVVFSQIFALLFVTGCASNSDKEDLEPAELVKFIPEIGLKKRWHAQVGLGQGTTYNRLLPLLDNNRLYVASNDGDVTCLESENGHKCWNTDIDASISGGVGNGDDMVYVATHQGEVLALNKNQGDIVWRKTVSSEVLTPPSINGDLLVVNSFDGKVYGLSATTGQQLWIYDGTMPLLTMRGTSGTVFYENLVIFGSAAGKLIALDRQTGQVRWERRVTIAQGRSEIERIVDVDATPLISEGIIYAVSYQGRIVAFEAATGRPVWFEDESSFHDMATGFGNVYVTNANSSVTSYVKRNGNIRWETADLARRQLTAPATIRNFVAVGDFEGYIHLISQVDGHLVARKRVDQTGIWAPALVNGEDLYVYGNSGILVAYKLDKDFKKYRLGAAMPERDEIMRRPGMYPEKTPSPPGADKK